ncbi:MAG: hypothetical protein PSV18_15295 [Methylobacter sp.]|nr:hypothetical protein [Candidatus Methylobacter titanis]
MEWCFQDRIQKIFTMITDFTHYQFGVDIHAKLQVLPTTLVFIRPGLLLNGVVKRSGNRLPILFGVSSF